MKALDELGNMQCRMVCSRLSLIEHLVANVSRIPKSCDDPFQKAVDNNDCDPSNITLPSSPVIPGADHGSAINPIILDDDPDTDQENCHSSAMICKA